MPKPSRCFFKGRPGAGRCDGRYDRAHLIPQRLLAREVGADGLRCGQCGAEPGLPCVNRFGRVMEGLHVDRAERWTRIVWDHRAWVPACRRHHGMLDNARTVRLGRADLPAEFEAYVVELGGLVEGRDPFGVWVDEEYGERSVAA